MMHDEKLLILNTEFVEEYNNFIISKTKDGFCGRSTENKSFVLTQATRIYGIFNNIEDAREWADKTNSQP